MDEGQDFECFVGHLDGCAEVVVRGEIDMGSAGRFAQVVHSAIAVSPHLVLDMSDVTFLDSSGLTVVVKASQTVSDGGSVTIRNAPQRVMRVFEMSGVDEHVAWQFVPEPGCVHRDNVGPLAEA